MKNWPTNWGERIEIIGIPFAKKVSGNWQLKVSYIDLDQKTIETKTCELPLELASYLKIGTALGRDFTTIAESGYAKNITISNLLNGSIISLKSLDTSIYNFKIDEELYQQSCFYKITVNTEVYLFFCFELFRNFFLNTSFLNSYTMSPPEMELIMDKYEIKDLPEEGRELKIYFNEEVHKSILTDTFIKQFTLTNFHPQLRSLWSNTIKAQKQPESKNHFHFLPSSLENLVLKCRVKRVNGITIVYEIKEIRGIQLPFEKIETIHPDLIEAKSGSTKSQFIRSKNSESEEVDYHDPSYNPSKRPKTIQVDTFPIKLGRPVSIKLLKSKAGTAKDAIQKRLIAEQTELENLSVTTPQSDSKKTLLNIETTDKKQVTDFEEVSAGLQLFAKSIDKLSQVLKISFSYTLLELPGTSQCSCIDNGKRKLMVVTLHCSPTHYVLEVDPSNNKPFSTLVLTSLEPPDFTALAAKIPESGCKWPLEALNKLKISFQKVKHPYIGETRKFDSPEAEITFKIFRHARNILLAIQ